MLHRVNSGKSYSYHVLNGIGIGRGLQCKGLRASSDHYINVEGRLWDQDIGLHPGKEREISFLVFFVLKISGSRYIR